MGGDHRPHGAYVSVDHISAHLAGRIARYKIPKNVVIDDPLPRTASGIEGARRTAKPKARVAA